MKNIVIIGATSALAIACAQQWALQGARFFLVARNAERLQQVAADLTARGAQLVAYQRLDIDQLDAYARAELGSIDIALVAPGTLPDQDACQKDAVVAVREFNANAVSVIALLTPLANMLRSAGARRAGGHFVRGRRL
jgi:decaprenylphospho-beta-D-erythro-pentofuranosid-2-ulose 2-reductase